MSRVARIAAAGMIAFVTIAGFTTRAYAEIPRDPSCSQEGSVKSVSGDEATTLRFVNNTGSTLQTLWLDYTGERVFYENIQPRSSYDQPTWVTHPWIVADPDGGCYLLFVADGKTTTVTINDLRSSSTYVQCDRDATETTLAVLQCNVQVSDSSTLSIKTTPTGTVAWSATVGSFFGSGSCTLGATSRTGTASCTIEYRANSSDVPIGSAPPVTATYSGDTVFMPSQGSPGRLVPSAPGDLRASATTVTCDFGAAAVEYTCQALVADKTGNIGAKPTGIVRWESAVGTFPDGDSCTLATTLTGASSCTVVFRGTAENPIAGVTAAYQGDSVFSPSSGGISVTSAGDKLASATAVSCNRDTNETAFALLRCNAVVADASGGGLTPSGDVDWTAFVGSFPKGASCRLTGSSTGPASSCMVEYRAASNEVPIGVVPPVTASYQGDARFEPSFGAPRQGPEVPDLPVGVIIAAVGAAIGAAALAAGLAFKAGLGGLLHPAGGGTTSGTSSGTSSTGTPSEPDAPEGPDLRMPR